MRIYVAAMYSERREMLRVHARLISAGHEPTSRWVGGAEEQLSWAEAAVMDMDDIARADALLGFTLTLGSVFSGGGRHVELGMALATGKRVFIVGGIENVFHHHPCVVRYESLGEFLAAYPDGATPAPLPLPSLKEMVANRTPQFVMDEGGGP